WLAHWRNASVVLVTGRERQKCMGIEQPVNAPKNTTLSTKGGAKSGAFAPANTPIDTDLASVIDAWPTLPAAIRAGILAMVRTAGSKRYLAAIKTLALVRKLVIPVLQVNIARKQVNVAGPCLGADSDGGTP